MKVILVDDEKAALVILKHKLLSQQASKIEILAECNNAEDAIVAINSMKPDLVFLDIEMPNLSGFDILSKLQNTDFHVIFATAHEEFVLQALRVNAIDYLLKPVDEDDLSLALSKVENKMKTEKEPADNITKLLGFFKATKTKLQVPTAEGTYFIPYEEIIRIEADGSYSHIFAKSRKKITTSKPIGEFDFLDTDENEFMKVHKSTIINLNMVAKYKRGDGGVAVMIDDVEVDIARRRKDDFLRRLELGD
jgi:two-component system, LytTR family, response regulator